MQYKLYHVLDLVNSIKFWSSGNLKSLPLIEDKCWEELHENQDW